METNEKLPGYFKLPEPRTCTNPFHTPPMHIYVPPGMGYRHICPACGRVQEIYGSHITC